MKRYEFESEIKIRGKIAREFSQDEIKIAQYGFDDSSRKKWMKRYNGCRNSSRS